MKFESFGASRSFEQEEIMEKAGARAEEVIAEQAIQLGDFADLYGESSVAADLAYVREMEASFQRDGSEEDRRAKSAANIAEAVLGDGIGLHDWFGESAHFIIPSRYDDIRNGVDGLVEFSEEPGRASHLGLGIDATFRRDVGSKFRKLEERVERGEGMRMKYFQSEVLSLRGELADLPGMVAAFDYRTVAKLGEMWITKDRRALEAHPAQFQVLEQLVGQSEYLAKVAGSSHALRGKYEHAREVLGKILAERRRQVEDTGERDDQFHHLMSLLR